MIRIGNYEVKFKYFPNGECQIDDLDKFEAACIAIYDSVDYIEMNFKWESDSDLIKLMFVKRYIDSTYKSDVFLKIFQMPYQRMDRREDGSPLTLKYVAEFINGLNFKAVQIIEPHSDVTCALINNSVAVSGTIKLVDIACTELNFNGDNSTCVDYFVFPDAGSQKRYIKDIRGVKTLVAHKHRDWDTGEIQGLQIMGGMDVASKSHNRAIIVDDLSSYGGTFYYTALELKELGFDEIYLVVAHCENSIYKGKLLKEDSPIDKIFTTDSLLTKFENEDKLQVFKIEELLGGM